MYLATSMPLQSAVVAEHDDHIDVVELVDHRGRLLDPGHERSPPVDGQHPSCGDVAENVVQ